MALTTKQIIDWMDNQIASTRILKQTLVIETYEDGTENVLKNLSVNATDGIHIGAEAVRYIAERLDTPIYVKRRITDTSNPYELVIIYRNTLFFGIESEEEYRERGAVV